MTSSMHTKSSHNRARIAVDNFGIPRRASFWADTYPAEAPLKRSPGERQEQSSTTACRRPRRDDAWAFRRLIAGGGRRGGSPPLGAAVTRWRRAVSHPHSPRPRTAALVVGVLETRLSRGNGRVPGLRLPACGRSRGGVACCCPGLCCPTIHRVGDSPAVGHGVRVRGAYRDVDRPSHVCLRQSVRRRTPRTPLWFPPPGTNPSAGNRRQRSRQDRHAPAIEPANRDIHCRAFGNVVAGDAARSVVWRLAGNGHSERVLPDERRLEVELSSLSQRPGLLGTEDDGRAPDAPFLEVPVTTCDVEVEDIHGVEKEQPGQRHRLPRQERAAMTGRWSSPSRRRRR